MKIFLFQILMIMGFNTWAGQPSWPAPSEQLIATSALGDLHIGATRVIVNELENPLHNYNQKELFFDYNGVTYNCTITFPERIFFNPEMKGYSVGRIDISDCQNYANGESESPFTPEIMRRSEFFRDGVIFRENNRSFVVSPYARMLYDRNQ